MQYCYSSYRDGYGAALSVIAYSPSWELVRVDLDDTYFIFHFFPEISAFSSN